MLGRNLRDLLKSLLVDGKNDDDYLLHAASDDVERSVELEGEETRDLKCDQGWLLLVTTDQLNQSRELINDPVELLELAKMNLEAAKALRGKSAFFPALSFADHTLELLGETKWTDQYHLSLEAMTVGLELDYYVGRGERCISRVGEVMMHANTLPDKFRAYFTLLDYHNNNKDHEKARDVGHDLLRQLGVKMPRNVGIVNVGYQFMLALKLVGNRSDEDLLSIPATDSESTITKIKIFFSLLSPAYWTDRMNEFAYMVMLCMRLTLKEGMTEMAGAIFSSFGGMCAGVGKTNTAFRFGRLGEELNRTIGAKAYLCKSMVNYYGFVFHMRNSYYASLDTFLEARRIGMEVGHDQSMHFNSVFHAVKLTLFPNSFRLAILITQAMPPFAILLHIISLD
jgi:predicted ATPase